MNVYFIPGLAADRRVFRYIQLPEGYEKITMDWIPALQGETLQAYALRLASGINTNEPFVLAGLSMGGMMAVEIAKKHKPLATILVSSVPGHKHFPSHFRLAYALRLHRLIPAPLFKSASIMKRIFTTETPEIKQALRQVIRDADSAFIKWGLDAILQWKNVEMPEPLWHIHGTKDELLPVNCTTPTHRIEKGTHLMVMSKAGEINGILKEIFSQLERNS